MTAQTFTPPVLKPEFSTVRLHLILRIFLIAQILDILSTFTGLSLFPGMIETNPMLHGVGGWIQLILIKLIVSLAVFTVLVKVKKWPPLVWLVPSIAILPFFWNAFNILAELIL